MFDQAPTPVPSADEVATALREIDRKLTDTESEPLAARIDGTRRDLARLFALLRTMESLRGREYALQILVRADSELDRADEHADPATAEAQLAWASHDLKQATAWLEGANSEPLDWSPRE